MFHISHVSYRSSYFKAWEIKSQTKGSLVIKEGEYERKNQSCHYVIRHLHATTRSYRNSWNLNTRYIYLA